MQCAEIMTRDCPVLSEADGLQAAVVRLLGERQLGLPVVDTDGRYIGMFTTEDILALVIPRVALAGDHTPNLRFAQAAAASLAVWKDRTVGDVVNRNAAVLAPDTPQSEAVRIFARSRNPLAVVDPADGTFLGVLTFWDCIAAFVTDDPLTKPSISA